MWPFRSRLLVGARTGRRSGCGPRGRRWCGRRKWPEEAGRFGTKLSCCPITVSSRLHHDEPRVERGDGDCRLPSRGPGTYCRSGYVGLRTVIQAERGWPEPEILCAGSGRRCVWKPRLQGPRASLKMNQVECESCFSISDSGLWVVLTYFVRAFSIPSHHCCLSALPHSTKVHPA